MTAALRCDRATAERALALYDARLRGGYKNQVIAARQAVKQRTGLGVRELRRWLADDSAILSVTNADPTRQES